MPPLSSNKQIKKIALCFFLSGLAALLYQTAWIRQLSVVFGTSELGVATVLTAYMSGLSLGAAIAGKLIDKVNQTSEHQITHLNNEVGILHSDFDFTQRISSLIRISNIMGNLYCNDLKICSKIENEKTLLIEYRKKLADIATKLDT